MSKRAIVDVDGTLWDMWTPVRELLEMLYDVKMERPDSWNYHRQFVTDSQFYRAVRSCHAAQIMYEPFRGACLLFDSLDKTGHEVIVASHRVPQRARSMAQWLDRYGLKPYSGIYCGCDKHFLIGPGDLVIDDRPDTIVYAGRAGAQAVSLIYKYNQEALRKPFRDTPTPVGFRSLEAMAKWVITER